jgi:diguanylate cyclase (GGDEF)-like protein/PAS domain S-box-containing protein
LNPEAVVSGPPLRESNLDLQRGLHEATCKTGLPNKHAQGMLDMVGKKIGASDPKDPARHFAVKLMEHLVVPAFVIDRSRRVMVWNRACERLTGVSAESVVGTRSHWKAFYKHRRYCLADLVALDRADRLMALYAEHNISAHGLGYTAENWCVMPQIGTELYLAIDAGPVRDDDGQLIGVVETLRDMTAQKRAEEALKALASLDGLTGLANRRSFDEALATACSRSEQSGAPVSVLIADVDHFKAYNDFYGHQKGDECLRTIAAVIRAAALRPLHVAARYGGEEFVVLMPDTPAEAAVRLGEQLRQAIHRCRLEHLASDTSKVVTVSIGAATMGRGGGQVPEAIIMQADEALYAAKRSGRDRLVSAQQLARSSVANILGLAC